MYMAKPRLVFWGGGVLSLTCRFRKVNETYKPFGTPAARSKRYRKRCDQDKADECVPPFQPSNVQRMYAFAR
jgi:hypothetical protein